MLLWVNCHSGFMMGLVVLAVELGGSVVEGWVRGERETRRWRVLAGVLGASVVAGLCSPNGIHSYIYPFTLLTHQSMLDSIGEWLSPNFHLTWLRPFEILLIGGMLCWGVSMRPRRVADVVMVLGLVQASLYSTRHVPIFAIVCAPIVAEHVGSGVRSAQAWLAERLRMGTGLRLAAGGFALVGLLALVRLEWQRIPPRDWFAYCAQLDQFPHQAVDWLKANPGRGNLLNEYNWGGYCLYRLYPDQKVFIDGRAEVYFGQGFADYSQIVRLQAGWGDLLDQWHVDTILVPPDANLARALTLVGGWNVAYQDEKSVIFRRQS
jgi:hypothetical protein